MMSLILIDPLLRLVDKGIDFLRENERQRKRFFEEVVKPLEAEFDKLYEGHIATFRETRDMLLEQREPSKIASFVAGRILFEQGTTELLVRLTKPDPDQDWRDVPSGNDLKAHFAAYVASIARCLISPDYEARPSVAYYLALHDVVQHIPSAGAQHSVQALERIVERFQAFYGEVKEQYARLHRYCAS
jgi:hypothetical protein